MHRKSWICILVRFQLIGYLIILLTEIQIFLISLKKKLADIAMGTYTLL